MLMEKIDSLGIKKEQIEKEIERLKEKKQSIKERVISAEGAFSSLQIANKQFSKLEPRQQKRLLSELIKKIVVYKDRVSVECWISKSEAKGIGSQLFGGSNTIRSGGESGIRTRGTLRYAGFQNRCFRPLSHLSFS